VTLRGRGRLFVLVYEGGFDRMKADCRLDVHNVIPLMLPVETRLVQSTSPPPSKILGPEQASGLSIYVFFWFRDLFADG